MKRLWLGLMLISCTGAVLAGGKGDFRRNFRPIPDHYIVVLDPNAADVPATSKALARHHGLWIDRVYERALKGFAAVMSEAQAKALSLDPRVEWVEEDGVVEASTTQTGATWGLDRIDQRDLPLNSTYTYNATGLGVKVYIIDTGIRASHSDFRGRVASGFTAIIDGRGTDDCNGHGTHVAGTVAGTTYGVAKEVTLVPVRVLNCVGLAEDSKVIAAVDWITSDQIPGQPAVANMSFGGGASSAVDQAVVNSIAEGVTYVVAAGNYNIDACNISPARVTAAITVGATDSSDKRASYSDFGTCVDIFAPGSGITSDWYTSDTATNTISGTSMASPHVAGVAALYLQTNPTANFGEVWNAIRNSSTRNRVTGPGTGSPNRLLYSLLSSTPPPSYEGYFEFADCNSMVGWAWDGNQPNTAINVDIYDGGTFLVRVLANLFRQDLVNAGKGNGYHGFNILTPSSLKDGQPHSVSAVFAGTTTNLIYSPRNLTCAPNTAPTIADGSFEKPQLAPGTYVPASGPTINGSPWTFAGSTGQRGISTNGSAFTAQTVSTTDGNQVGFIQGDGNISQTVFFPNSGTYQISVKAIQRKENQDPNGITLSIEVDGTARWSGLPGKTSYTTFSTPALQLAAGNHTITIRGGNPANNDNTVFVDLVKIQ